MSKLMTRISAGFLSLLALVGARATMAAADADLGNALASTTAFADDNKAQILNYIVGLVLVVFVIVIAKKAIMWGFGKLTSVFGGRRRR